MNHKALVKAAITEAFVKGDVSALDRWWSDHYIQHNPRIGNGREALKALFASMPPNFKYEPGLILEDGDFVMVHGRYTGFGPKPVIAVDIFRIKDGKLAEQWDVMQEEVPAAETATKNPMFPIT